MDFNEQLTVDYNRLMNAIRARKTKCADCARPLQESVTGVKKRRIFDGEGLELVCDACFYRELGEHLLDDMPRVPALEHAA